jgi:glycosyltransferase involved in cell wall biosynthesis
MAEATSEVELAMRRAELAEWRAARLRRRLPDEIARATHLEFRRSGREPLPEESDRGHSSRVTASLHALTDRLRHRGRDARIVTAAAATMGPDQPTIFIECTHTFHTDLNTGIQRVVRNILRNAAAVAAEFGYAIVPVMLEDGAFVAADVDVVLSDKSRPVPEAVPEAAIEEAPPERMSIRRAGHMVLRPIWRGFLKLACAALPFTSARQFLQAPPDQVGLARCIRMVCRAIVFRPMPRLAVPEARRTLDLRQSCASDILLLLDSSWTVPLWPAVERFKRRGGYVAGVIYDLIPISHSYTSVPELVAAFTEWVDSHARNTDVFVAISKTIANQLAQHLLADEPSNASPADPVISYFHLGSELDFIIDPNDVRLAVVEIFVKPEHVFMMVGSIEPRKNHAFVLDAFDRLWQSGQSATLVIIGHNAWKTQDVIDRIVEHPQFGQQLFLLRDATDSELDHAYWNASALIIASTIEGFGLPVVEAFQRGLPVLCSEIPVFREIADGRATFFDLDDPDRLAAALMDWCETHDPATRRVRAPQSWLTWRESTEFLLSTVISAMDGKAIPATPPRVSATPEVELQLSDSSDRAPQPAYARR